ncbi:hypothetical protein MFUL124B02_35465 [Myxococcus fulvus 124B02]|nr:hypothetical protein MFUL124B02_35465 [Myxococcus fulvus 124B02]
MHVEDAVVGLQRLLQLLEAAVVVRLSRQRSLQVELERDAATLRRTIARRADLLRLRVVVMMPVTVVVVARGAVCMRVAAAMRVAVSAVRVVAARAVLMLVPVRVRRAVAVLAARSMLVAVVMRATCSMLVPALRGAMVMHATSAVLMDRGVCTLVCMSFLCVPVVMRASRTMVMGGSVVMRTPGPVDVLAWVLRPHELQRLEHGLRGGPAHRAGRCVAMSGVVLAARTVDVLACLTALLLLGHGVFFLNRES